MLKQRTSSTANQYLEIAEHLMILHPLKENVFQIIYFLFSVL